MSEPRAPHVRVPHPALSLWQSVVREELAERYATGNVASPVVRRHELAVQADAHVTDAAVPERHPKLAAILGLARRVHLEGLAADATTLIEAAGTYSNEDPEFVVKCISRFVDYYGLCQRPKYRDWKVVGHGDIDFAIVEWRLPRDARIGVIGDWGTGLPDARQILRQLAVQCRPDALLHLGDVYYSGTTREAACNFARVISDVFTEVPPRIPVFNLPGNHDYYSGGGGFYGLLDSLNSGAARQAASYFCVRSEDDRWQLAGVDTGYNDRVPGLPFDPFYMAPALHEHEPEWLADKISRFPGRTLLFSHHQLFSAHTALNGPRSGRPRPNFNDQLYAAVEPHLDRIPLWIWGHEHSLAVYQDGLERVARARLVGCSAFEMVSGDDPYRVVFTDVPYAQHPAVQLSVVDGRYSHGVAVIDLGKAQVEYYELPARSPKPATAPADPPEPLALIYQEDL